MFLFGFSYKLISFNERILPFNFMDAVELQQKEKTTFKGLRKLPRNKSIYQLFGSDHGM